jgi:hypothetical protein
VLIKGAFSQTVASTLHVSLKKLQQLHTTMTLREIATRQHVTANDLASAVTWEYYALTTNAQFLGLITHAQEDASRTAYIKQFDALLNAPPSATLPAMFGSMQAIAALPHGVPFGS